MEDLNIETETTVLESINFPDGTNILTVPDTDGKPIHLLSYRISEDLMKIGVPSRHEILADNARTDMLLEGGLNAEQINRLSYAIDELKLPAVLAVHAALNTDLNLMEFPAPDKDAPHPVTLAMNGRPGVGKSFITAMLALKCDYEILNFDFFTGSSSLKYHEFLKEKIKDRSTTDLNVNEGWKLIKEEKLDELGSDKTGQQTIREVLDVALQKVLSSTKRAELYLCDMPGMPGLYDFGTGRVHGKERKLDWIDLMAWESCESGVISTHQLTDETMERKLNWIKNDVIGKNVGFWKEMRANFTNIVKSLNLKHY